MKLFKTLLVLLIFTYPIGIKAQFDPEMIYLKNYSLKQGLSQISVNDITQDYKGFIWIATNDGLNRFDGNNIISFKHEPEDPSTIPSSVIKKIIPYKNHKLFLKTNLGFCIFNTKTGRCLEIDKIKSSDVKYIATKNDSLIYVYTNSNMLLLLEGRTLKPLKRFKLPVNFDSGCENIADMLFLNDDLYIVSVCGHVIIFNEKQNKISLKTPPITESSQNSFNRIRIDHKNNLHFLSIWHGNIFFNTKSKKFETSSLLQENPTLIGVSDFCYDNSLKSYYISTFGQGLILYNTEKKEYFQYKKNLNALNITSNYISTVFLTQGKQLILGTDGFGFDVLINNIKKFKPILYEDSTSGRKLKFIRSIELTPDNQLLIGTGGSGLALYNKLVNKVTFINIKHFGSSLDHINDIKLIDNKYYVSTPNDLYVLTWPKLTIEKRISTSKNKNTEYFHNIWKIHLHENTLFMGTREGNIIISDTSLNKYAILKLGKSNQEIIPSVRDIISINKNKILIGTENGLFAYNFKDSLLTKVYPKNESDKFASKHNIKYIYIDPQKNYWLGTNGAGIIILDSQFNHINSISKSNYLPNNIVYSILAENDSTLWISSNAGLCILHLKHGDITHNNYYFTIFDETNGLQSNEFNTNAYHQSSDGLLAFGGENGLNIFYPSKVNSYGNKITAFINEVKVFENPYNLINAYDINTINLKHFENSLSLGFATLGFALAEKISYQYQLIGYDKKWINAEKRTYVSYTNLDPGKYIFQVRAKNNNDNWNDNDNITKLEIIIATPYYKTWWFTLTILYTIIMLIYALYRYRMKQALEKEKLKLQFDKEIAEVEMKALRAQINPHFIFNSLNSINSFILKNDNKNASRYLVKFSQLVRNILNNSSNPFVLLNEELHTIELYMIIEGMRFNNQFTYKITIDEKINTSLIKIPSMLLQPYIENAIWHGLLLKEGEKRIDIIINYISDTNYVIIIEDNGIGRKNARQIHRNSSHNKSFGMQLGEKRINLLNSGKSTFSKVEVSDLQNSQGMALGTRISITLPFVISN